MRALNDFFTLIDSYIGSAVWFPYALLGTGLFFTIYLRFPQIRYFGFALKVVRGKFDKAHHEGDTNHFQALTTALSGTVGTGNIAGVALAVHIGGPAAVFWMLMTAAVGMCTKFVEVTLSHKYREKAEDGSISGGPMYYMKNKLNMKWLAAIFAIATVLSSFGTGSLPQVNSISSSLKATFGFNEMLVGGILSVLLGLVIIGGIKRIAAVTSKLVPAMAFIYFIGALAVIAYNYENIIPSFIAIFADLFAGSAATGGFLGASIAFAFNKGVGRGLFSNEAGQGSAPIAHAAAKADEPVSEGLVAILEPFIDTIVICSLTALVLLSSGVWQEKLSNEFDYTDLQLLDGYHTDKTEEGILQLAKHVSEEELLPLYNGTLRVENGKIVDEVSVIHARSLAEDVRVRRAGSPMTASIKITEGKPDDLNVVFSGKSLVHSAPLTAEAFTRSYFGIYGQYIVSIGLLLFAFSTAISWSYYGETAMYYLVGNKGITPYKIVFCIIALLGAIWKVQAVLDF